MLPEFEILESELVLKIIPVWGTDWTEWFLFLFLRPPSFSVGLGELWLHRGLTGHFVSFSNWLDPLETGLFALASWNSLSLLCPDSFSLCVHHLCFLTSSHFCVMLKSKRPKWNTITNAGNIGFFKEVKLLNYQLMKQPSFVGFCDLILQ